MTPDEIQIKRWQEEAKVRRDNLKLRIATAGKGQYREFDSFLLEWRERRLQELDDMVINGETIGKIENYIHTKLRELEDGSIR